MVSYQVFSLIMLVSILSPLAAFIIIISLGLLEREVDFLEIENKRTILEKELHQSKFLQLSQQIHPHFLFNTLNVILSLGRLGRLDDVITALEKLSLFLRYNYIEKEPLVNFAKELTHTSNYLTIQKIRFGENLNIIVDLDPLAKETLIPPYSLQTLVENAFKHGLEKKEGEKIIRISLEREGNYVSLLVEDNGPENIDNPSFESGVGLKNIQKRFDLTFNIKSKISIERINSITKVRLTWPYMRGMT